MNIFEDIAVEVGHNDFLLPYIERHLLGNTQQSDDENEHTKEPTALVTIVNDLAELHVNTQMPNLPNAVLVCPNIVGTGMKGLPRKIAEGIYRGTYALIKDNKAKISVVHAVDVARAVQLVAGTNATYALTDTVSHSIKALSEAIAYRIDDKRLVTVKPWMAKIWFGPKYYDVLTSDHVVEETFTQTFTDFKPTNVVEYLKTHNYDQASL